MRKTLLATLTGLGLAISAPANAATLECAGTVGSIITYVDGTVMILGSWRNDWTNICSVKQAWKGVPPQTCYIWFSEVSSALTENKNVSIYYYDPAPANCTAIPTYAGSPAPGYVRIIK